MTELEILKYQLNLANFTIKQMEEKLKRKNAKIEELREKLREWKIKAGYKLYPFREVNE